jgi:hypothetical protein
VTASEEADCSPGPGSPELKKAVQKVTYGEPVDELVRSLAKSVEITTRSRRRRKGPSVTRKVA